MAFGKAAATTEEKPFDITEIFKPACQIKPSKYLTCGIYGIQKIGKTHFCMTAPGKKYLIDTENTMEYNKEAFSNEEQKDMFIYYAKHTIEGSKRQIDYEKSIFTLFDYIEKLIQHIEDTGEEATIVIDSITDIWEWLAEWLEAEGGNARADGKRMMRTEWGKANGPYMNFLKMLKDAPCDVIVTAKAFPAYDSKGGMLDYNVPKWQKQTPFWLLVILELSKKGPDRVVRFDGCRLGDVSGSLTNATYKDVKDYIIKESGITFDE